MTPSVPLKNARWEAFARGVARGLTFIDAYVAPEAFGLPKTPGKQVASSNLYKKPIVADRIGYLKAQLAAADIALHSDPTPITASTLRGIMSDAGDALLEAAKVCERIGETSLSIRLRTAITQHSTRAQAVEDRVKHVADSPAYDVDLSGAIRALRPCVCHE